MSLLPTLNDITGVVTSRETTITLFHDIAIHTIFYHFAATAAVRSDDWAGARAAFQ